MTLNDWLSRIEACHPSDIELGLDRVREVASAMALDFGDSRIVTIAGTNGKGSTQTFLEQMLRASGLSTGCYSSPHFLRYNERVRIDGEPAGDDELCAAFAAVEAARGDTALTYFEFGTLAALRIFADRRPDVVLLEVGLGGRLDAVNIVDPDVALLTTVALDHTDWLGDTRELIGREKAGIFRGARPAVCGDPEPPSSVAEVAAGLGAELHQVGQTFGWRAEGERWHWHGRDRDGREVTLSDLPLPGLPTPNAATALQALYLLLQAPAREAIETGLRKAAMTGRMQRVELDGADCILDVAHNPEAAQYIAGRLAQQPPAGRRFVLLGMLGDKDVGGVLSALAPVTDVWYLAGLEGPRAQSGERLAQRLETVAPGAEFSVHGDVATALAALRRELQPDDRVLIAGSFFTVSAALSALELTG
ncbi:bifunctional folylpolyglutamate synthase/dihydrofolate synthase [Marinobacterium nitratireducens]|uniref:Dihydrofolate synthase/folylpolyglutamate synthase n=1 Tax=Marinobacterium nitratireducens TaxID=518897 RepID=A0A918DP99_9GAMM|nr:bifunctional tetrahydrofolate synthase/dihydrofolate synthase [Marinobacterium nitratireducens]GGO76065.1 bifunctional folylpolyglutamate synthase/dihydrofolate synthase [Marinobacterium nitratireducens]